MSANLQYKLLNHSVVPPTDSWELISDRLNNEFDAAETKVADILYQAAATPPPGAWDRIEAVITAAEMPSISAPVRVIRFPYRIAAAAVLAGVVGFLTWNFLTGSTNSPSGATQSSAIPSPPPNSTATAAISDEINMKPSVPVVSELNTIPRRTVADIASHVSNKRPVGVSYAMNQLFSDLVKDIHCPNLRGLQAEATATRRGVNAPLIKDARGHVIMDEDLITTRDCYIVITSPNGEQTRISYKFLPFLKDLNGSIEPSQLVQMLQQDQSWQSRFSEWRSRLIQQASYMPAANNFLDIIELKDILQEQ